MGWFSGTGEVLLVLHALLSPFSPAMQYRCIKQQPSRDDFFYHEIFPTGIEWKYYKNPIKLES
jgi:hypothetical protein